MKSFFSNDSNFKPSNKIFKTIESNILPPVITEPSSVNTNTDAPARHRSFTNSTANQTENKNSVIGVAKRLFKDADSSYSSSFLEKTSYTETTFNSVQKSENNNSKKLIVKTSSSSNSSYSFKTSSQRKNKGFNNRESSEFKESNSFDSTKEATYQTSKPASASEVVDLSTISDEVNEISPNPEDVPENDDVLSLKQTIEDLKDENASLVSQNESCVNAYNTVYGHYTDIFDNFKNFRSLFLESSNKYKMMESEAASQKELINQLKGNVANQCDNIVSMRQELVQQSKLISMKDETINNLKQIISDMNIQNNKTIISETTMIKKEIESITHGMTDLKVDINKKLPEAVKDVTSSEFKSHTTAITDTLSELQAESTANIKQSLELVLTKHDPVDYQKIKSEISGVMQLGKQAHTKEIGEALVKLFNNFFETLSASISNDDKFSTLKDEVMNELKLATGALIKKMDNISDEVGTRQVVSKRDDHQNALVRSLSVKANSLRNELLSSNAQGFVELNNQFQNLFNTIIEVKNRVLQNSQTTISLNERLNDIKLGQINSEITLKEKFAATETDFIQFHELLMKLSDLVMDSTRKTQSRPLTIDRRTSTDSNSTPQSDNNFTRELSETNEFDELVSSEDEDSLRLRSGEKSLVNSSFKASNSTENVSLINSESSQQKQTKKVLFNESVTILNNGSTIRLAQLTKDSTEENYTMEQIDSLPDPNITKTDSRYINLSGLNSFFINTTSAQESMSNKKGNKAKNQLLQKMSVEDNKFNAFEELNTSNDSLEIDNIFKTHFKGAVGKSGSVGSKRRNLRNSVKTGQVNKAFKTKNVTMQGK